MDNNYHEKRSVSKRYKSESDRDFLIQVCKLALRLKSLEHIHKLIVDSLDMVQNGEGRVRAELVRDGVV